MTKDRGGGRVVASSGCRSLQFVPGFGSPAFFSKELARTPSKGPFSGLVICVTGLSKEARKQVEDATEKMGGLYSPDLHPQCTHLVVQSYGGRKFEHALKHGVRRGLHVVSLSWFINSAKLNERLDEANFGVTRKSLLKRGVSPDHVSGEQVQMCLPSLPEESKSVQQSPCEDRRRTLLFKGFSFYLDPTLSDDLQTKVVAAATTEGAAFCSSFQIGSGVTHVICDRSTFVTYIGSVCNLVTPLWLLKSLKEQYIQRMVQFSADLARAMALVFDFSKMGNATDNNHLALCGPCDPKTADLQLTEREELVSIAKAGVRRRRGPRKQPCRTLPRPITSATLLDSVCWSVTDAPSDAKLYVEKSPTGLTDATPFFDTVDSGNTSGSEGEFFTRDLRESERQEVIYAGVFLTVLFPIDRFVEMGPSSRTFFSENGFTRQQVLDHIHEFYQECVPEEEVRIAIHTDSKHADKLRALFASRECIEQGSVAMRRCELLGGRRNFEGLKRISRENTAQVYELCLGC